jgi:hypothetical protein
MDKRLTRSDFVFILVFIFMLIFALGAFFSGMKIGTDRTEAKYYDLVKERRDAGDQTAYNQSYLVSFYHTVYLPFREFNVKWSDSMEQIESQTGGTDASSLLKSLSKLAEDKYQSTLTQTVPDTSPLLVEAQEEYLKSLKLFSKAADSMQASANQVAPTVLMGNISKDASFTEAKNFALSAQKKYFDSIVKWHQLVDSSAKGTEVLNGELAFNDWSQLDLNLKNAYLAGLLIQSRNFSSYTPQDVTLRVDDMIRSGQAKKLNLTTVPQVVELLINTHAVRLGDFVQGKSKYYGGEMLPQLPFFSKME